MPDLTEKQARAICRALGKSPTGLSSQRERRQTACDGEMVWVSLTWTEVVQRAAAEEKP